MPSFSRVLEQTLHGALEAAATRRHEYATLEHLLLALIDDEHASRAMLACNADLAELREGVTHYLDTELQALVIPVQRPRLTKKEEAELATVLARWSEEQEAEGETSRKKAKPDDKASAALRAAFEWEAFERAGASPTSGFQRVVQRAILHVQSSGREEVTGANVLVALFSERESYAVFFLQQQDMSRLDVVSFISHGVSKANPAPVREPPPEPLPAPVAAGDPPPQTLAAYKRIVADLKPHIDAVSLQPTLATPRIAAKVFEFIYDLAKLYPDGRLPSDCALTVGVYGSWGSGKSTLLSTISRLFAAEGAIVVGINAWKWDGEKNIHDFLTEQLLAGLSGAPAFRWKARAIRLMLVARRRFRRIVATLCALLLAFVLYMTVDLSTLTPTRLFSKDVLLGVGGVGTIAALVRLLGKLAERCLIRPKVKPEPGVQFSLAFQYLLAAKRIGDTAGKPLIFVFDDLDRCDPDRVVRFVQTIQGLTLVGAINIIGCDDAIISAAIYKQFKDIADLSGEGRHYGARFLEKIVQVHFRMPDLSANDLIALGLKPDALAPGGSPPPAPVDGIVADAPGANPLAGLAAPVKDLAPAAEDAVDDVALSIICGEVLGAIVDIYRLPIRRVKFLANIMKLYTMVFPPTDMEAAYRLVAFVGMASVDEPWLRAFSLAAAGTNPDEAPADATYRVIRGHLGDDPALIAPLYRVLGIGEPRR